MASLPKAGNARLYELRAHDRARASVLNDALLELRAIARAGGGWLTAGSAAVLLGHVDTSGELVAAYLERLAKNRAATARLRAERMAGRVCIDCGAAPLPGGTRCELHARRNVERTLAGLPARRRRCVEQGLCVDCGEPAVAGRRRCARHLEKERVRALTKRRARQQALRAADEVSR